MGAPRKTPQTRQCRDYNVAINASCTPRVEQLRKDFAKFRRTHQLRTRIPESLRLAILAALKNGAKESELRCACGITSNQIAFWRQHHGEYQPKHNHEVPEPRIYPVVDEPVSTDHPDAKGADPQNLELHIGGWAICIRQLPR